MIPIIILAGLAVGAMDLVFFMKTNELGWLAWATLQLFLTAFLIFLYSLS